MMQNQTMGEAMQTFAPEHLEVHSLWRAVKLAHRHANGAYGQEYLKYLDRFSVNSKQPLSLEPIPEVLRRTWIEVSSEPHDVRMALLLMDVSQFLDLEVESTIQNTIANVTGENRISSVRATKNDFANFQQRIRGMYELMSSGGFGKRKSQSSTLLAIFRNKETNQLDGFIDNMVLLRKIMNMVGRIDDDVSDSEIVDLGYGSSLIEINVHGSQIQILMAMIAIIMNYLAGKQAIHKHALEMYTGFGVATKEALASSQKLIQDQVELAKSYARQGALKALGLDDKEKESSANILFNDLLEFFEERDGQMIPRFIDEEDPEKKDAVNALLELQDEYHETKLSLADMREQLRLTFSEEE